MFYNLHTTWQMVLLLIGLAAFTLVSWRWPKIGAWLVIFLAPLYLLKINSWPLTVLEALIWVFVGIWIIKKIQNYCHSRESGNPGSFSPGSRVKPGMTKEKVDEIIKSNLFWPILLVLIGVALATFFSADRQVSLGILKAWFAAPIIFAVVFNDIFKRKEGVKVFLAALAASAASVGLVALVYLIVGWLTFDGRLSAFYLSPNHLAMWLVPGLLAGLGLWSEARKTWQKAVLFLVVCFLSFVLYRTYSYGAWLGLAVAIVFIFFYFWRIKLINWRRLFFAVCLLSFVFASMIFIQLSDGNNEKLTNLLIYSRSSWQSRLMIWQSAVLILKDHGLIGVGPGLFQPYYLAYQEYFSGPYLEWAVPQPHNLWLAWWLQAGLLGVAGFLWLVMNFFRQTMLAVKHHLTPTLSSVEEREKKEGGSNLLEIKPSVVPLGGTTEGKPLLSIILMAVMVYFLVHGLVDTTFWKNDLALIWWAAIFLGCKVNHRAY